MGSGGDCSDVVETWSREAGGCALYATDTRIGCRLSLPPGKALRCSPWGTGEALRCLLLRTAEKALRCFPLRGDLTWCREVGSGALYVTDT